MLSPIDLEYRIQSAEYYFATLMDQLVDESMQLEPVEESFVSRVDNLFYTIEAIRFLYDRGIYTNNDTCLAVYQDMMDQIGINVTLPNVYTDTTLVIPGIVLPIPFQGPQGPSGPQGSTGAQGAQGFQGAQGPQGSQGNQGPQGFQGSGTQGPQGAQGAQGFQGPQGFQGANGTSVVIKGVVQSVANLPLSGNTQGDLYIVLDDGDGYVWDGAQWDNVGQIQGPQGPAGPQGNQGPQGFQGAGTQGPQGPQGPSGGLVSGTTNRVVKFINPTTVGDSAIVDDGTTVSIPGVSVPDRFDVAGGIRLDGPLTLGGFTTTNEVFSISRSITGNATSYGIRIDSATSSDVTAESVYVSTHPILFHNISAVTHYRAGVNFFGGAVTNQTSFWATSTAVGATNNYGFRGSLPAAANNWNIYLDGSAKSYISGKLLIGSPLDNGTDILQVTGTANVSTSITSPAFIVPGGSPFQFLKADGTVDNNSYVTFGRTITINGVTQDLSQNRTWTINPGQWTTSGSDIYYNSGSVLIGGTFNIDTSLKLQVTGRAYVSDRLGIGTQNLNGTLLGIVTALNGASNASSVEYAGSISNSVTNARIFRSFPIQSESGTIGSIRHFSAEKNVFLGTVNNQYGFFASSSIIGAGNNYGFYGEIDADANRWNLYMAGTASNYLAGNLGVNVLNPVNKLEVGGNASVTGNVIANAFVKSGGNAFQFLKADGTIDSNSYVTFGRTLTINGVSYDLSQDRSWTITSQWQNTGSAIYYNSGPVIIGSNFNLGNSINLQVSGDSYLGERVGIGSYPVNGTLLSLGASLTGATTSSVIQYTGSLSNTVTTANVYRSYPIQSESGVLNRVNHFIADKNIFLGTVNSQFGFVVSSSIVGATNNYGFYGDIPSGAGRWNIYINGTANNYIAGNLGLNVINPTNRLEVGGNALISGSVTANSFVKSGGTGAQLLAADGTVIVAGSGISISGGVITSSGGSSQWTTSGSDIYYNTGNVGIGVIPSYKLDVAGTIYASGDVIAYSDISVKENIRPIENALSRVLTSRGIVYDRIDTGDIDNIGFIAQELEISFPELVVNNPDGTKAVKYANAGAVSFEAIKELHEIIVKQQKQIDELILKLK